MDEQLFSLKILATIGIFVVGVFSATIPNGIDMTSNYSKKIVLLLKFFSAGILFGTAMTHLLPDSEKAFLEITVNPYPYSYFLAGGSFIIMMAIEEMLKYCFNVLEDKNSEHFKHSDKNENSLLINNKNIHYSEIHENNKYKEECDDDMTNNQHILNVTTSNNVDVITLYFLEFAIAIHSIIIGISIGTSVNLSTFLVLSFAIAFHQCFEGIAMGTIIMETYLSNTNKKFQMILFFSVATPIGIIIGILLNMRYSYESHQAYLIEGFFNSISAGILLHMSLYHFIFKEINNKNIKSDFKRAMYWSLFLGYFISSLIAIYT